MQKYFEIYTNNVCSIQIYLYIYNSNNNKKNIMEAIKLEIEKTAKEINATEIEVISAMQGECAKQGNEEMIGKLAKLKWDYIK